MLALIKRTRLEMSGGFKDFKNSLVLTGMTKFRILSCDTFPFTQNQTWKSWEKIIKEQPKFLKTKDSYDIHLKKWNMIPLENKRLLADVTVFLLKALDCCPVLCGFLSQS